MINKALATFLLLTLAFCTLAIILPPVAFAEAGSVVYGSVYVDGSPLRGVIVSCGDQSTTTLRSGNYYLELDTGVTVQVLAAYDEHVALSDEFVTCDFPIRKDLNIIPPGTSTATSVPIPTPAPTPSPGPSITRTYRPDMSAMKAQSPGFTAMLALLCMAGTALFLAGKRGR
jgi:hypothetical protein